MSVILTQLESLAESLASRWSIDLAGEAPLIIAGSGRSGTTWLAELCNYNNDFRYVFEPLNPDSSEFDPTTFNWCPSPGDEHAKLLDGLLGVKLPSWSNRFNKRLVARRRLVKEIRLNLALPWIAERLPSAKLVNIVRNPLAVAASKKRLAKLPNADQWVWKPELNTLLDQPGVRSLLSGTQYKAVKQCVGSGVVSEAVADWCLNNLLIAKPGHTVWYENLRSNRADELQRLFQFAEIDYQLSVANNLAVASATTRGSIPATRGDGAADWHEVLEQAEIAQAKALLSDFDLGRLYDQNWHPVRSAND